MTQTPKTMIPDVQNALDLRQIPIHRVGVKDVRFPLMWQDENAKTQASVGKAAMLVALPKDKKGTHMSRFMHMIYAQNTYALASMQDLFLDMLARLEAVEGRLTIEFTYFFAKHAPVSEEKSLLDVAVRLSFDGDKSAPLWVSVTVPVTSLCPCSKEISQYGAHNQRSHIIIEAQYNPHHPFAIADLIEIAERGASCPIWGVLKRPDEKYVTEHAYDNPKFVEDIVRDVAGMLNDDPRMSAYRIASENFESIHNHSAYAEIISEG